MTKHSKVIDELEVFVPIMGFEGHYSVSNFGRVYSNKSGKMLKQFIASANCYYCVSLSLNNIRKNYTIHRLVARHFIPNPDNKRTVNHIDGVKTNNLISNLEWATDSEQSIHSSHVLGHKPWNKGNDNRSNKECPKCSAAFKTYLHHQVYCSKECASQVVWDRKRLTAIIERELK